MERNCTTYLGLPLGDVAAADGGGDNLDADLHGPRRRHLHLLHHQRLPRSPRHRRCTHNKYRGVRKNTHLRSETISSGGFGFVTSAGDGRRRGGGCSRHSNRFAYWFLPCADWREVKLSCCCLICCFIGFRFNAPTDNDSTLVSLLF